MNNATRKSFCALAAVAFGLGVAAISCPASAKGGGGGTGGGGSPCYPGLSTGAECGLLQAGDVGGLPGANSGFNAESAGPATGDACYQSRPKYDCYGHYLGKRRVYVCR